MNKQFLILELSNSTKVELVEKLEKVRVMKHKLTGYTTSYVLKTGSFRLDDKGYVVEITNGEEVLLPKEDVWTFVIVAEENKGG